ncbi:unnamed protein product, partial [Prorocentrum cordatum]
YVIEKLKNVWSDKDLAARDNIAARRRDMRNQNNRDLRRIPAKANYQDEYDDDEHGFYEGEGADSEEVDVNYEAEGQTTEDLEALEAYAEDAEVYAQDAHRAFTEAKKMLAEAAKNRSGYFPVIGVGQLPGKTAKDPEAAVAAKSALRPPKPPGPQAGRREAGSTPAAASGETPGEGHGQRERSNAGTDGNGMQMVNGQLAVFADTPTEVQDPASARYSNEGINADEGQAGWVQEEMVGYAIIGTGATKSMIGLELATSIPDVIIQETSEDHVEMDYSKTAKFTYAGGGKGGSIGRFGLEHLVALVEDKSKLWFDLVESKSPMLLGLDCLEKSGADLIKE